MPDDEGAAARAHLAHELRFGEHGSERGIAAADSLGADDQIGNYTPVIEAPAAAGAPKPGHHLVSDEEDSVAVADLTDPLEVSGCGGNRAERGANDRLGDERGDIVGA